VDYREWTKKNIE